MSRCNVIVENYNGCYYPGSQIIGRVECYLTEETKLRSIKVRLICKEYNRWTTPVTHYNSHTKRTETRYVTASGENYIIYNEIILDNVPNQRLPSGMYSYPYSYVLPFEIPSTYKGPYGAVFYELQAIADRPLKFDYKDSFQITVLSIIDFNYKYPDIQRPVSFNGSKSFFSLFGSGGRLDCQVELEKLAFVPGETINMKVLVSNNSKKKMGSLRITLKQLYTYKVNDMHLENCRTFADELIKIKEDGVNKHDKRYYDLNLTIPTNCVIPNFTNCTLFHSKCCVEVRCKMLGISRDLFVHIDPIMGHVVKNMSSPAAAPYKPSAPLPLYLQANPIDFSDLPPPYEQIDSLQH